MYYVYIIKSEKTGKMYTGSTEDLRKRILEHNMGKVLSTKASRPWEIIYYEAFVSKRNARREEIFLKTGKGRERIKWLLKKE
jgi:putative endonuclease